jgi:GR25 family glycosyltransferase involved in LPS biosynthesis
MGEEVKYAILSIDESRRAKKEALRNVVSGWDEIAVPAVVGAEKSDLESSMARHGIQFTEWIPKVGEAGVWMSQMNAWETAYSIQEPLVVFEDDAILAENFIERFETYTKELPEGWDVFCLFVPENQYGDFHWKYKFNELGQTDGSTYGYCPDGETSLLIDSQIVSKAYQGYGCVALMFSPEGGRKLLEAAREKMMYTPVDCFIFEQYRAGRIDAYAFKPGQPRLVDVDWGAPSTIQQGPRVV